ncbi:hypothetical protein FPV16_15020 [Methylobacterium sp. W2]|uniref:hypothetical protein n=1 Tax=Methylobacterium sp. W2 TaxID=2598107 RepID=UPI001D0BFA67|nr:hypothetical protein [Methylobacterium sp. W2]MCC0807526.1 hypothetical protein [Methylobacterium sp. W2]
MSSSDERSSAHALNFILTRFVSGLWQGQDQFAVSDVELIRAYGSTDPDPLLQELGEGWSVAHQTAQGETLFLRIITTRQALDQLGF